MVQLDWTKVVERFAERFESEFSTCSKKAHFDCVPPHFTVIDGARSKWCHLLLVNAVVGILDFESFNLAARRKFNQQQVLCECIKDELMDNGIVEGISGYESVEGVFSQDWSDMKSLRNFLEQNAPYKSKEKYLGILDILLHHSAIMATNVDIKKCINAAIVKILAPSNRKPGRRPSTPTPIKSKRLQLSQPTPPPQPILPPSPSAVSKKRSRVLPVKLIEAVMTSSPKKKIKRKPYVTHSRNSLSAGPVTPIFRPHFHTPAVKPESVSPLRATRLHQDVIKEEETEDARRPRGFSFDGEAVFIDHEDEEDLDPNAQPWELLDPMPSRETSPVNFRRLVGPFGSAVEAFPPPNSLGLLNPEVCKLLVPFPDCLAPTNVLHMSPFPLDSLQSNSFYQRSRANAMF